MNRRKLIIDNQSKLPMDEVLFFVKHALLNKGVNVSGYFRTNHYTAVSIHTYENKNSDRLVIVDR